MANPFSTSVFASQLFKTWSVLLTVAVGVTHCQVTNYDTIRFFTNRSKPETLAAYAISPNGRYLALSFGTRDQGGRSGMSIVDLETMQLLGSAGHFSFFTLAFSDDSQKVFGIGRYAGAQEFNLRTGFIGEVRLPPNVVGKVGLHLGQHNGKLIVRQLFHEFNPQLKPLIEEGDELLALNDGEPATWYDDSDQWKSLIGKTEQQAAKLIAGSPGTWVQLRLLRSGAIEPFEVCLQRQWPNPAAQQLPRSGRSMTLATVDGHKVFRSANTARECAFVMERDTEKSGLGALSPDGKLWAWIAKVVDKSDFCVEIHSLETGRIVASAVLDMPNYRAIRFSADSSTVLVGTRDSVEVLDVKSSQWQEPVSLTPIEQRDLGHVATRRVPLGFGFPGDLFTTFRELVYSDPAALRTFDVSVGGVLAIASETGDVSLVSMETKQQLAQLGEAILGPNPTLIEFTPMGDQLVAYANGILHIFKLNAHGQDGNLDETQLTQNEQ